MRPETRRRLLLLVVVVAGIGAGLYWREQLSIDALTTRVDQLGWLAPLVFIGCYAIGAVLFLPGLVFTLAGGVLFGPLYGTFYNLSGATLGATLSFLVARYVASDWAAQHTGTRLRQLINGVETEGWRFVAFVRLVPLFPFNLLNYALGLTNIRLWHYIISSFVFMAPGAAAYTYLGYAGGEVAGGGEDVVRKLLLGIAVVASIAFASRVMLRRRRDRNSEAP